MAGDGNLDLGAVQQSLAYNYYRSGQEFYDKGDLANAASVRGSPQAGPGSTEAGNAERYFQHSVLSLHSTSSNQPLSRSEKRRGRGSSKQVLGENKKVIEPQNQYLKEGGRNCCVRQGQAGSQPVPAAQSLKGELESRGVQQKELAANLKVAEEQLSKASATDQARKAELRDEMGKLKSAGD